MPVIISIGTATPPYEIGQEETREFAGKFFAHSFNDLERLLKVFQSTKIEKRAFCMPHEWFEKEHSWEEKNALFVQNAICLSAEAINNCLQQVNLKPSEIDIFLFITSTGISTPSIDAYLYNLLGMRANLIRLPIWGLGCAGGVSGIARGMELALAIPESKILVCCVELCGLTFVYNDRSKANLIATSLFADGAAAALIIGDQVKQSDLRRPGFTPQIRSSQSFTWSDTLKIMGWDIRNNGMMVIFSKDIPSLVSKHIRPEVDSFLSKKNLTLGDISRYITHPGGIKVLQAYEKALDLKPDELDLPRQILKNHGNMSSCTVLYILKEEIKRNHRPGEYGLMLTLGPGFSCEQVLLQW